MVQQVQERGPVKGFDIGPGGLRFLLTFRLGETHSDAQMSVQMVCARRALTAHLNGRDLFQSLQQYRDSSLACLIR
jgi:hypothetical protein